MKVHSKKKGWSFRTFIFEDFQQYRTVNFTRLMYIYFRTVQHFQTILKSEIFFKRTHRNLFCITSLNSGYRMYHLFNSKVLLEHLLVKITKKNN